MMAALPRSVRILALGGLLASVASASAIAGSPEDHRVRGWTIATQLCSYCHVIGRAAQPGEFVGPAFVRVAEMPSTTGPALAVFLQSHHERMPSLRLDRDEMEAVIDYILSLKTERTAPAGANQKD